MSSWSAGEHPLFISGPAGALETVLTWPEDRVNSDTFVVVCHPNPVQGGTMNNKVVTTIVRFFRDKGYTVLRFNFRGTGESEGIHDEAVGEIDDLAAVLAWGKENLSAAKVILAGFSFGSYIAAANASNLKDLSLERLILVAPPATKYRYPETQIPPSTLLLQGDQDEVVDAADVFAWAESRENPPEIVRFIGAGHFFHGRLTDLKAELASRF